MASSSKGKLAHEEVNLTGDLFHDSFHHGMVGSVRLNKKGEAGYKV
jgi:hypothetical protein